MNTFQLQRWDFLNCNLNNYTWIELYNQSALNSTDCPKHYFSWNAETGHEDWNGKTMSIIANYYC